MRKIREYKPGQQDRGVAVVLTIGVLGMMLMLTMAFAASALMSHRIATLNRDTVLSRLAAEMGVQRAYVHLNTELSNLNDMRNLFPATKPGVDGHIGPDTASTAWDGRTYWFSENDVDSLGIREAFAHQLAGVDITPDDTHAAPHEDAGWIHVYHPDNATEIIARMSYVLIDESGKIDPNYAISQSVAEGSETTARYGLSPADLNLAGALPSALSGDLQYDSHSGGDLATTMQWLSHYHIFRAADSAEDNSDAVLESLFPHSYDIEAFNDSLVDRHRFDLTNADWDAFGNDVAASSLTSAASEFWNGTAPAANIGGIPWLAECSSTFLQNQIAANLIDYCDSDSIPTTDSQTEPSYLGLELVPYINELMFQLRVYDAGTEHRLLVRVWAELANIYDTACGSGATLTVELTLASPNLPSSPTSLTLIWNSLTSDVPAQSYTSLRGVSQAGETSIGADTSIENITVQVIAARLEDSAGNLLDFATSPPSPTADVAVILPLFRSVEVSDPRQNHTAADWEWDPQGWQFGFSTTTTLLATNSNCTPDPGGSHDQEDGATDPWDVSTAHIANSAITTLWELGAIHRGQAWRTIRLTQFNETLSAALGLSAYSLGDANILDQVKLGGDNYCYGNLNANSDRPNALAATLVGLSVGAGYSASTSGTATINSSLALAAIGTSPTTAASGQWLFENGTAGVTKPMFSRGGLARITTLSDGTIFTQGVDAAREEIIGKIANIMTTRPNYFTMIITAQSVRDNKVMGALGTFDADTDVIRAEARIMAYLYRDALTHSFRLIHYEYIE